MASVLCGVFRYGVDGQTIPADSCVLPGTETLTVLNTSASSLHELNQLLQFPTLLIVFGFVLIKFSLYTYICLKDIKKQYGEKTWYLEVWKKIQSCILALSSKQIFTKPLFPLCSAIQMKITIPFTCSGAFKSCVENLDVFAFINFSSICLKYFV